MDKRTDMRVQRTQRHLRCALLELAGEKPCSEITVKELAERAEISRGTFYLYYDNIPQMVQSLAEELGHSFVENAIHVIEKGLSFKDTCIAVIRHPFIEAEDMETFVSLVSGRGITQEMIFGAIALARDELMKAFDVETHVSQWKLDYVVEFLSAGISSVIMRWENKPIRDCSFDELTELTINILYNADDYFVHIERK